MKLRVGLIGLGDADAGDSGIGWAWLGVAGAAGGGTAGVCARTSGDAARASANASRPVRIMDMSTKSGAGRPSRWLMDAARAPQG